MNARILLATVSLAALGGFAIQPAAASTGQEVHPFAAKALVTPAAAADDSRDSLKDDGSLDKGDLGLAAPASMVVADDSADGSGDSASSSDSGSSDSGSSGKGDSKGEKGSGDGKGSSDGQGKGSSDGHGKGSSDGHGGSGHSSGHSTGHGKG